VPSSAEAFSSVIFLRAGIDECGPQTEASLLGSEPAASPPFEGYGIILAGPSATRTFEGGVNQFACCHVFKMPPDNAEIHAKLRGKVFSRCLPSEKEVGVWNILFGRAESPSLSGAAWRFAE